MQIDSKVRWAVECLNSIDLCYLPGKSMKWLRNTELVFSLARKNFIKMPNAWRWLREKDQRLKKFSTQIWQLLTNILITRVLKRIGIIGRSM
jgi:hypothetical protein